uniref:Uncharacterized protein n=1 Tax=Monopterus albus TaxID=43700 RepID=A0A3Q3IS58_MONAL
MSADRQLSVDTADDNKLVRTDSFTGCRLIPDCLLPKVEFRSLLQHAGATKDVFTMKEVMFYLGQYIIQKQLYDQKQQHIVHCAQDALGRVLGIDSFSVKEPRLRPLFPLPSLASWPDKSDFLSLSFLELPPSSVEPHSNRSSHSVEDEEDEEESEEEEEEGRKRRRSDSYSLTFDGSLSWCVIGGLGSGQDRRSSQSSESRKVTVAASDSDSDNFSVEFEVESIDSDDYNEDDASLSADDQVYEVTICEADDDDSFDEDTEISEAVSLHTNTHFRHTHLFSGFNSCEELNPPLPRHCLCCWTLRQDWLPEASVNTSNSPSSSTDVEENEGVDVPDGKRAKTPPLTKQGLSDSTSSELLPSSPIASPSSPLPAVPELERSVSAEWRLPESCLEPCVICQSRPKNGCIVHGRTGHLMSCYVCARKLKKRNKLCPVCRLPIQSVILTYLS